MTAPDEVTTALLGLDELLLEEDDLEQAITTVLQIGMTTFGEEPEISLTISSTADPAAGWTTRDATSAWARRLDEWQYENDEGPCIEADATGEVCVVNDVTADERFPAFAAFARDVGLRSCVSFPMPVRDASIGSINAFYEETGRVTDDVAERGHRLAASAAPLVANWLAHRRLVELTSQLEEALAGRSVIERAKGLLMGELAVDEERAFDLLRTQSQHENVKLRDVAARLLDERSRRHA